MPINDAILHYTMDNAELTGVTMTDNGSGHHNGTLANSPTTGVTGQISEALTFASTSSQYISIASPACVGNSTAFTICGWAKAASAPAAVGWIYGEAHTSDLQKVGIDMSSAGKLQAVMRDDAAGTTTTIAPTNAYADGNWYFVALVQTAKNARSLFIYNAAGTLLETVTNATVFTTFTLSVASLGAITTTAPANYYTGSVDDWRTYSRDLSADDLAALVAYTTPAGSKTYIIDVALGSDTTGNGSAWNPFASPAPACIGGSHPAASGDTIQLRAGTYPVIATPWTSANGVTWNRDPTATIDEVIINIATDADIRFGSGIHAFVPAIIPGSGGGVGGTVDGFTFIWDAAIVYRSAVGSCWISGTYNQGGPSFGNFQMPGEFTVQNCKFNITTVTSGANCPAVTISLYAAEVATLDGNGKPLTTDTLLTGTTNADGNTWPPCIGHVLNNTFTTEGMGLLINVWYIAWDATNNQAQAAGHMPSPYRLDARGNTFNITNTTHNTPTWTTAAISAWSGSFYSEGNTITVVDNNSTEAGQDGTGPAGTKGLFCGTSSQGVSVDDTITVSRPQDQTKALALNTTTVKVHTPAQIVAIGSNYVKAKVAGPNISDPTAIIEAAATLALLGTNRNRPQR